MFYEKYEKESEILVSKWHRNKENTCSISFICKEKRTHVENRTEPMFQREQHEMLLLSLFEKLYTIMKQVWL